MKAILVIRYRKLLELYQGLLANFENVFVREETRKTSPDQAERKTNTRDDQRLFRMVREKRRQTLEDLINKFNNTSVDKLSSGTVRRCLFESGY
jgi:hypothetical protein